MKNHSGFFAIIFSSVSLFISEMAIAQCYVSCHSSGNDTLSWVTNCNLASFGCLPIDPTFWLAGNVSHVTVKFAYAQTNPSIRVWGMNTDDSASVLVNGSSYSLNSTSASYNEKVVCGLSPGPDGIIFANGKVTGANTPTEGNYSYQDLTINTSGIDSITITSVSGAGWGVAGASVDCKNVGIAGGGANEFSLYPNPTAGIFLLRGLHAGSYEVSVTNDVGNCIRKFKPDNDVIDISGFPQGIYFVRIIWGERELNQKVIKF